MSTKAPPTTIRRVGYKQPKHISLSLDLIGVLNRLVEDQHRSRLVERTVWNALIDEYGHDAVQDALDEVQPTIQGDVRLDDHEEISLDQ